MYYILSVSSWTWVLANGAGGVTSLFKCIYNLLLYFHSLYTWGWQCVGSGHKGPHYSYLSIYIHRQEVDVRRPTTTVTLPYIHGLSEALRRILTQLDIKVVFHPLITLRHMLVHPKDPVPLDQQKGVVYSIPYNECPKVYIGQTGRTLRHRLAEHRQALKNVDVAASALAEHTLDTGHPLDLTKAEVLDHHLHTMTRCLLESWRIQNNQGTLNREKGTLYLRCTSHS